MGEEQAKRQYIRGYHAYIIIWKPLVGEYLYCVQESPNEGEKNAFALFHTNFHCKGEVVAYVQQKYPWLYRYFYPCPMALWTSLKLQNMSTTETKIRTGNRCKFTIPKLSWT